MTLLSNAEDDDSLMRINNPAVAEELLEFAVFEKLYFTQLSAFPAANR